MDFSSAVSTDDIEDRNSLIEGEITGESWEDRLSGSMTSGGWPQEAWPSDLQFEEDDEQITVTFYVDFTESIPTSCKDVNLTKKLSTPFRVRIRKDTGQFEVGDITEELEERRAIDGYEQGKFYPDDYN